MHGTLPKTVHVIDTRTNRKVIATLRTVSPLPEVDFSFIQPERAIDSLRGIDAKAVLMWGDGSTHHFSHYFDMRRGQKGRTLKRIVDNHDDFGSAGFGFTEPTCANHVGFSAAVSDCKVQLALTPWCSGYLRFLSRLQAAKRNEIELIRSHIVPAEAPFEQGGDKIHLSLDFDAINLFPAEVKWITLEGFSPVQVLAVLDKALLSGNLVRLDFGGLADGLGNILDPAVFEKRGIDISQPPDMSGISREDIIAAVQASERTKNPSGPSRIFDEICALKALHYALNIYYRTLVASLSGESAAAMPMGKVNK